MEKKYNCPWCENVFYTTPKYIQGSFGGKPTRHKGCLSSPVICTKCKRLIPVWKKEIVDGSSGRKHIHLRG